MFEAMLGRSIAALLSITDRVYFKSQSDVALSLQKEQKTCPGFDAAAGIRQGVIDDRRLQEANVMQESVCEKPIADRKGPESLPTGKLLKDVSRAFARKGSSKEESSSSALLANAQHLKHRFRTISLRRRSQIEEQDVPESATARVQKAERLVLGLPVFVSLAAFFYIVAPWTGCWGPLAVIIGSIVAFVGMLSVWPRVKDEQYSRGKQSCSECKILSHNKQDEQDQLVQRAQRAKQQFMAYVFHNIRVPFNAIVLGLGHLRASASGEDTSSGEDMLDLVQLMLDCAETMTNVLDDVTDMGNWEEGRIELNKDVFDLLAVVKFLAWGLKDLLEQKQISLNIDIDPVASKILEYHNIVGDKHRTVQTLGNFLSNAVKFTPPGGKLDLEIRCEELDAACASSFKGYNGLYVTSEHKSIKLFIAVHDSGAGIAVEDQDKLFEPDSFISSAWIQKAGVSGLGLSVAKRFIEQIGGQIGVRSREQGSTFFFSAPFPLVPSQKRANCSLPASGIFYNTCTDFEQKPKERDGTKSFSELDAVVHSPEPIPTPQASPCKRRVLLVEDTRINRIILRKVLQNLNLQCDEAENGQIAVDLHRQGKSYDLVLMDKEMPVMDGHEATRTLRMMGVKTPIVALTGNALQSDKELFFEAGVNEFQTKPLSRDKLIQLLARYGVESSSPSGSFASL